MPAELPPLATPPQRRLTAIAWLRGVGLGASSSVIAVVLSLLVCFLIIAVTRGDLGVALDAYLQMLQGGLGDFGRYADGAPLSVLTRPWGESGTRAALLMFTGLAVAVGLSAGLLNIGAQGQLVVGAILAAVLGAAVELPAPLHVALCLLGAAAGGAAWASLAAWLKVRRGVHEVISTIMLNWVAVSLVESWLVVGPLGAVSSGDLSRSGTEEIHASAQLPRLLGDASRLNLGAVLALAAVALVAVWLYRTRHGFETRAVGLGPEAARTAGIPVERRVYEAMALSGALAGLAGAVVVLGTELHYPGSLGGTLGFDGIAIALIGQGNPLGVGLTALVFGVLRAGGTRMQLLGVHKSFPELIQGLALLFFAGRLIWEVALIRRRTRAVAQAKDVEVPRA